MRRPGSTWYGRPMSAEKCPCCSDKEFESCCGPLLEGAREAATAEELLRSRYTAFTRSDVAYIRRTRHPRSATDFDEGTVRGWAEGSRWHGLEIVKIEGGAEGDEKGAIDFVATFTDKESGGRKEHKEHALFLKEGELWLFVDGDYVLPEPFVRPAPKIGRNDPCPCGSGKKHKKCCGA
jgi:SEC-C motif domain protein